MNDTIGFTEEDIAKCRDLDEKISWKHPHFRDERNTKTCSKGVTEDVLQGRLAEVAVYKYLKKTVWRVRCRF